MKKLLFVLLASLMLFGCQKKDEVTTPQLQDVSFNATETIPEVNREDWPCKDVDPTHAWVQIDDGVTTTDYYLELFTVGDGLYTQSMKLLVGSYSVETFVLYQEVDGATGIGATDIITHGTPYVGFGYSAYVNTPLPIDFDVAEFEKEEINIEVLCFIDVEYDAFGFDWFEILIIELDHFCFFGDICLNGEPFAPADFEGSMYDPGSDGLPIDIPAIMRVKVKQDGVPIVSFVNEGGQSLPLCVPYDADQDYTFELWLWLPGDGGVFSYQLYHTYTYTSLDGIDVDMGDDQIIDFVVGTCGYEGEADQTFDFLWTPPTANFESFPIRNQDGTTTAPWDTDMYLIENAAGNGFSTSTPNGGEKMGYGTHQFDGIQINTINTVDFDILVGNQSTPPYINFWVTDGVNYAVISSENNYRGTDFMTRQEWKVFETNMADLDWLFDSGTGGVSSQYLTLDGVKVTLADFSSSIYLEDPGTYPSPIGTGAPRGGYGFQLINGDTQSNYTNPFIVENIIVTVGGVTFYASN